METMKSRMCLIAMAGVLAASPAFADMASLVKRLQPAQPAQSIRTAQRMCLKAGEECCCERVGLLCCEGLQCVTRGNRGFCR
jgi:hypothetical protein